MSSFSLPPPLPPPLSLPLCSYSFAGDRLLFFVYSSFTLFLHLFCSLSFVQLHWQRNYHVFYEMMAGLADPQKKKMMLSRPEDFFYLNQACLLIGFFGCLCTSDRIHYVLKSLCLFYFAPYRPIMHAHAHYIYMHYRGRSSRSQSRMTWKILIERFAPWKSLALSPLSRCISATHLCRHAHIETAYIYCCIHIYIYIYIYNVDKFM